MPLDTSRFGKVTVNRAPRNPVVWYGNFSLTDL